jgi:predicted cupin superfamily sugar epimerase
VTAEEVRRRLGLVPLPFEGGYYAETWRADEVLPAAALPERYGAPRALGTAILYLLEPGTCSRMHRLRTDETYHFLLGDPAELLVLEPGRQGRVVVLGGDLAAGLRVQFTVPRGAWQGGRVVAGGAWSLFGVTLAPGFDRADFEAGSRDALTREWPAQRALIDALSR